MKIKYFKINSPFRGLPKGFSLSFRQHYYLPEDNNEPICMVGLNGSGKSNSLEVLSELFYYLELQTMATKRTLENIEDRYSFLDFELHYEISQFKWQNTISRSRENNIPFDNHKKVVVICTKESNEPLNIEIADIENIKNRYALPSYLWAEVLPNKIIGYSSGQNELISNPFIKLDYYYFDEFIRSTAEDNIETNTEINRMFFMDYESNELIVLANYLFDDTENNSKENPAKEINNKLNIQGLHSFSLKIQFRNYDGKEITFPSQLNLGLEQLKQCATLWDDNEKDIKNKRDRVIRLSFFVDIATKKAFRNIFKSAYELFRFFYLLRLMNLHCISPSARKKIKEAKQGFNLGDILPKPEQDKLVFKIQDICFRKLNVSNPVRYKHLSDGEHQLLHVLGTLRMISDNDALFLLDEPETHFNPEWRAKMIKLIMQTNRAFGVEQDHFITSHSPFIISDCKPTNVYLFYRKNGKLQPVQTAHDKKLNTYGTSVSILTEEIFNKQESQGEFSGLTIKKLMNRQYKTLESINKAKEDARILGDSVEKTLLFRKLLMLENDIKTKNKNSKK